MASEKGERLARPFYHLKKPWPWTSRPVREALPHGMGRCLQVTPPPMPTQPPDPWMGLWCLEASEHTHPSTLSRPDEFHFPSLFAEWPGARRPPPRPDSASHPVCGIGHASCLPIHKLRRLGSWAQRCQGTIGHRAHVPKVSDSSILSYQKRKQTFSIHTVLSVFMC